MYSIAACSHLRREYMRRYASRPILVSRTPYVYHKINPNSTCEKVDDVGDVGDVAVTLVTIRWRILLSGIRRAAPRRVHR